MCQGVALSGSHRGVEEDCEDEPEEKEGPGKGNAIGGSKAPYARRKSAGLYDNIRHLDRDVLLFEGTVHLTREDFDALHVLVLDSLLAAMDVRGEHDGEVRFPRRRRLDTQEMFMFLDIIGGGMREGLVYRGLAIDMESPLGRCRTTFGTFSSLFLRVFILFSQSWFDGLMQRAVLLWRGWSSDFRGACSSWIETRVGAGDQGGSQNKNGHTMGTKKPMPGLCWCFATFRALYSY